jgi:hypothetical protein
VPLAHDDAQIVSRLSIPGLVHLAIPASSLSDNSVRSSKVSNPPSPSKIVTAKDAQHCILKGLPLLCGEWFGESVDDAGTRTGWQDTNLEFQCTTSTNEVILRGKGVSEWKSKRIPFNLQGTLNFRYLKSRMLRFVILKKYAKFVSLSFLRQTIEQCLTYSIYLFFVNTFCMHIYNVISFCLLSRNPKLFTTAVGWWIFKRCILVHSQIR